MGTARPFIKWAGGKRQLLDELLSRVPEDFNVYHEFFLGGGALFFELCNQGRMRKAVLSDLNPKLMNVYRVVKARPHELIEELTEEKYANDEKSFYKIRSEEPADAVERAARFIYLNKTAFNGLYRENLKGEFNVPFGRYKHPAILDSDGLLAASEALSCATLLCGDFSKIADYAEAGDFAYFDPPYFPVSATANFTSYTAQAFTSDDQIRLKNVFDGLSETGVTVLLSNSHTAFIADLFVDCDSELVSAKRMINCKAEKRGKVKEMLISN